MNYQQQSKHFEVYLKKRNKKKNPKFFTGYFSLDVVAPVIPVDFNYEDKFDFLKNKTNTLFYATISRDNLFVAILEKSDEDKHYWFLEMLKLEEFSLKFKIIGI